MFGDADYGLRPCDQQMRCGYVIWVRDEGLTHIYQDCDVPFEDHDDTRLGHEFVEPEAEERDDAS